MLRQFGGGRLAAEGLSRRSPFATLNGSRRSATDVWASDARQVELFARVRAERANVWAALDLCLREPDQAARGIAICRDLWAFWQSERPVSEVVRVLETLTRSRPGAQDRPTPRRSGSRRSSRRSSAIQRQPASCGTRPRHRSRIARPGDRLVGDGGRRRRGLVRRPLGRRHCGGRRCVHAGPPHGSPDGVRRRPLRGGEWPVLDERLRGGTQLGRGGGPVQRGDRRDVGPRVCPQHDRHRPCPQRASRHGGRGRAAMSRAPARPGRWRRDAEHPASARRDRVTASRVGARGDPHRRHRIDLARHRRRSRGAPQSNVRAGAGGRRGRARADALRMRWSPRARPCRRQT